MMDVTNFPFWGLRTWRPVTGHIFNWVMRAELPVVPTPSCLTPRSSTKTRTHTKELDSGAQTGSALGGGVSPRFPQSPSLSPTQTLPCQPLSLPTPQLAPARLPLLGKATASFWLWECGSHQQSLDRARWPPNLSSGHLPIHFLWAVTLSWEH